MPFVSSVSPPLLPLIHTAAVQTVVIDDHTIIILSADKDIHTHDDIIWLVQAGVNVLFEADTVTLVRSKVCK